MERCKIDELSSIVQRSILVPRKQNFNIRLRQAYTLFLYLSAMGRVSPVPNHTFHTYRFPYPYQTLSSLLKNRDVCVIPVQDNGSYRILKLVWLKENYMSNIRKAFIAYAAEYFREFQKTFQHCHVPD